MRFLLRSFLCALSVATASAQLTTDQRLFDFQSLAALYAKRYAPLDWKKLAFGFDALNISPWLARVRAAPDDLAFFEIEAEYVASLNDTHSGFTMTSTFSATLGITVDIYDGKVLIDSVNRVLLPASSYPFAIGDELVSVDGKSAEDWIALLSKWKTYGNPGTTRRSSAGRITVRSQSIYPHAVDAGDTAQVSIRRANGDLEDYTIPWLKSGVPVHKVGPVPSPHAVVRAAEGGWPTGFYSESSATNTNTLVVRKAPIVTPDLPAAPYVENIGVRPDVPLDYMTRDNLLNNGKTFVDQFTAILVNQIQPAQ
jgi:hypothetical protein